MTLPSENKDTSINNIVFLHENGEAISIAGHSAEGPGDASENNGQEFREMYRDSNENPTQSDCGDGGNTGPSKKRKSALISPISSTRVLRTRTQEKPKSVETINASAADNSKEEKKRKRRKRKQKKQIAVDELSGIKSQLKYLMGRIKYEQSLIDAYSGEGWKGQSLEKLKPEKELQRAKSGIFHYKLKIRDLFLRIDASLSQGQFPESLFDSDGQIDSEDIFCAKCGSKELPADNDIILCDGACERGFHQMCLEPPLLKEDIPPDEEGWLCPGCDCKVECVDLLNDLLETDLSVTDSWEKVFPEEAAAAASGKQLNDIAGLPSDDSEDDDYNPDSLEVEENILQDESNSDESDSPDTSLELRTPNDELLGLPSEDSEDDDYDPDALESSEQAIQISSNSDIMSDSEDFAVVLENNTSPGKDHCEKKEVGGARHSLKGEIEYLLQSNAVLPSGKRHVERLDYKTLHDETYGIASSDSSDEDYEDTPAPKSRNEGSGKTVLNSSDQTHVHSTVKNVNKTSRKRLNDENLVASESGSCRNRNNRLKYGDGVIKTLSESFKENHYPKRAVKESLARELGLTLQQVGKWFQNTRWSLQHPSTPQQQSVASESPTKSRISSPQTKKAKPAVEERPNVDVKELPLSSQKTGGEKHITAPESKSTSNADHHASNPSSDDSEDDDYNPDNMEIEENASQDESRSDESDSSHTSFELKTPIDELLLGLPSEDSEDDDYDPDAPERKEQVMQDRSSSDFTSDSEDFGVIFENNTSPGEDHCEKIEVGGVRHSLKSEVEYLLQCNSALASGKRHVERLDYKKLHDEAYGIASSDSSDEDYEDNPAPGSRKERSVKSSLKSSDQTPVDAMVKNVNKTSRKRLKHEDYDDNPAPGSRKERSVKSSLKSSDQTPVDAMVKNVNKTSRERLKREDYEDNPAPGSRKERSVKSSLKSSDQTPVDAMVKNVNKTSRKRLKRESLVSSESGSTIKRKTRIKFGEDAIKRLSESFKENRYPNRDVKESLARELGVTLQQVVKWFDNSRQSFNNLSTPRQESVASGSPTKSRISSQKTKKATPAVEERPDVDAKELLLEPKTRSNADHQASNLSSGMRKPKKKTTPVAKKKSRPARRSKK